MNVNLHLIVFCVVTAVVVQKCTADISVGSCPSIERDPDVSMNKLLGIWYVIQKTSVSGSCLVYNITKDTELNYGQYLLTKTEQRSYLFSSHDHEYRRTEKLTVPNSNEPGVMEVHVPFTIGTPKLTVVITDHDHYLGILTCKQYLKLVHSWSAVILSRTPTLPIEDVERIQTRFSSYNVDPCSLTFVSHKNCGPIGSHGSVVTAATNYIDEPIADEDSTEIPEVTDVTSTPLQPNKDESGRFY